VVTLCDALTLRLTLKTKSLLSLETSELLTQPHGVTSRDTWMRSCYNKRFLQWFRPALLLAFRSSQTGSLYCANHPVCRTDNKFKRIGCFITYEGLSLPFCLWTRVHTFLMVPEWMQVEEPQTSCRHRSAHKAFVLSILGRGLWTWITYKTRFVPPSKHSSSRF
jgi:hypothetical protein